MTRLKNFGRVALLPASVVLLAGLALAGCAQTSPAPVETTAAETTSTPAPTYAFVPDGGAADNLPYFDQVLKKLVQATPMASARDMVDALVDAGFDKSKMEVTSETTPVGTEATFVIVSVLMPDQQCLLGQRGPDGSYASLVQDPISTGRCQLAEGIDIDW